MKILPALLCAASASVFATAAGAADLSAPVAPPTLYANTLPAFSWTGLYLGLEGGYSWSHAAQTYDNSPPAPTAITPMNGNGWLAGIEGGANYQLNNNWVVGVELDAAFDGIEDTIPDALTPGGTVTMKTDVTGNVRGRLGYAFNRTLLFGTAGLAIAHTKISSSTPPIATDDATQIGWSVGAGVEQALTDRVSAKLEYQYTAFGNHTWFPGEIYAASGDASASTIRAGLNYHF
jgi:outer membrane immunogenic protein